MKKAVMQVFALALEKRAREPLAKTPAGGRRLAALDRAPE